MSAEAFEPSGHHAEKEIIKTCLARVVQSATMAHKKKRGTSGLAFRIISYFSSVRPEPRS
jgi:hypothetical protein